MYHYESVKHVLLDETLDVIINTSITKIVICNNRVILIYTCFQQTIY